MPLPKIPEGDAIVGNYLREHADVKALGARVVGITPKTTAAPWVRITQIDAANSPGSRPEHLIEYLLQLDCYAGVDGGQEQASDLNGTVRAVLDDMAGRTVEGVVISSVKFTGNPRLPDTNFEPARERYVLDAIVHAHR